jgi:hypothetical protein
VITVNALVKLVTKVSIVLKKHLARRIVPKMVFVYVGNVNVLKGGPVKPVRRLKRENPAVTRKKTPKMLAVAMAFVSMANVFATPVTKEKIVNWWNNAQEVVVMDPKGWETNNVPTKVNVSWASVFVNPGIPVKIVAPNCPVIVRGMECAMVVLVSVIQDSKVPIVRRQNIARVKLWLHLKDVPTTACATMALAFVSTVMRATAVRLTFKTVKKGIVWKIVSTQTCPVTGPKVVRAMVYVVTINWINQKIKVGKNLVLVYVYLGLVVNIAKKKKNAPKIAMVMDRAMVGSVRVVTATVVMAAKRWI